MRDERNLYLSAFIPHPLRVGLKRSPSTLTLVAYASITLLIMLGCRVADVVAQAGATPTGAATRTTPRPTFTRAAPTPLPTDTALPAKPGTTRPATLRPVSTRTPTPPPPPPVSTPDPYGGFVYRPSQVTCVTAGDTRIQGTVSSGGQKQNNVWVRVSSSEDGGPVIPDFLTGVDPKDPKHIDGSLVGKYQLGLREGGYIGGTWFVFVLRDADLDAISPKVRVVTDNGPGNNICTVDFSH